MPAPRCVSCAWFVPVVLGARRDDPRGMHGHCRRRAPAPSGGFPVMYSNDWCGEHVPDESSTINLSPEDR